MKARLALTIAVLILYAGLFNVYIFNLTRIDIRLSKLFYNYLTIITVAFFGLDMMAGFVNRYHKQFNLLLFLCILVNYGIIILVHHLVLHENKPKQMFYSFNISVFVITLTIFICEIKYKQLRD